jgi:hypothetical protein
VILLGGIALIVVLALLFAVGRGGDDGATTTTQPAPSTTLTPTTTEPPLKEPATDRFVAALAARDPEREEELITATAPASPARSYAEHQTAARQILGSANPGSAARVGTDGYRICSVAASPEQAATCSTLEQFEVDADGLITTFNIEGFAIADRVVAGGPPVRVEGISVAAASGYRSGASDSLTIVITVTNSTDSDFELFPFAGSYQAPVGPAVSVINSWGTATVAPDETVELLVQLDDAELQGVLTLTGWSQTLEGLDFAVTVTHPA